MPSEILDKIEKRLQTTLADLTAIISDHVETPTEFSTAAHKALGMMLAGTDRTREGIEARDHADALSAAKTALDIVVDFGEVAAQALCRIEMIKKARRQNRNAAAVAKLIIQAEETQDRSLSMKH